MTKHKTGESTYERRYRRIIEHNTKAMEKMHIDIKKHSKQIGEHFKRIVSTFSDKEMDEAMKIGLMIGDKLEPEDGFSYEEIAAILWGDKNYKGFDESIPEEYRKDDAYIAKINRLLYVLKNLGLDFTYNTTIEPEEEKNGGRNILFLPCVRLTKKIKNADGKMETYDEPYEMIFNGIKLKYRSEELIKSGEVGKWRLPSKDDELHEELLPITRKYSDIDYNNKNDNEYKKFLRAVDKILAMNPEKDGVPLEDGEGFSLKLGVKEVFPEAADKHGEELEPYWEMINDALKFIKIMQEHDSKREEEREDEQIKKEWRRSISKWSDEKLKLFPTRFADKRARKTLPDEHVEFITKYVVELVDEEIKKRGF